MAKKKTSKSQESGRRSSKAPPAEQGRYLTPAQRLKNGPAGQWPVPRRILVDPKEYRRLLSQLCNEIESLHIHCRSI